MCSQTTRDEWISKNYQNQIADVKHELLLCRQVCAKCFVSEWTGTSLIRLAIERKFQSNHVYSDFSSTGRSASNELGNELSSIRSKRREEKKKGKPVVDGSHGNFLARRTGVDWRQRETKGNDGRVAAQEIRLQETAPACSWKSRSCNLYITILFTFIFALSYAACSRRVSSTTSHQLWFFNTVCRVCYRTTKRSLPTTCLQTIRSATTTKNWLASVNDVRHVADRRPFYTDPLPLELLRITIVYVLPRLPCCVLACVCVAYSLLAAGVHAIVTVRFRHATKPYVCTYIHAEKRAWNTAKNVRILLSSSLCIRRSPPLGSTRSSRSERGEGMESTVENLRGKIADFAGKLV